MPQVYDVIGRGYRRLRRPDRRIGAMVERALGDASTVLNVGAGAGSYEPRRSGVLAVEPARTMIAQRPAGAAPVVRASGTALPFADASFDALMGILTLHHWPSFEAGLEELRRVARDRIVILTWEPSAEDFWLYDYFPDLLSVDKGIFPPREEYERVLGPSEWHAIPIPHDCTDGFLAAYWRRPTAYLDAGIRGAISTFSKIDAAPGVRRLRRDINTGSWERRHGAVLRQSALDLGYRLCVSRPGLVRNPDGESW